MTKLGSSDGSAAQEPWVLSTGQRYTQEADVMERKSGYHGGLLGPHHAEDAASAPKRSTALSSMACPYHTSHLDSCILSASPAFLDCSIFPSQKQRDSTETLTDVESTPDEVICSVESTLNAESCPLPRLATEVPHLLKNVYSRTESQLPGSHATRRENFQYLCCQAVR